MKYESKRFKDGQVTAKIIEGGNIHIKIRGNSYEDLFKAAAIKEAWDAENATNKTVPKMVPRLSTNRPPNCRLCFP